MQPTARVAVRSTRFGRLASSLVPRPTNLGRNGEQAHFREQESVLPCHYAPSRRVSLIITLLFSSSLLSFFFSSGCIPFIESFYSFHCLRVSFPLSVNISYCQEVRSLFFHFRRWSFQELSSFRSSLRWFQVSCKAACQQSRQVVFSLQFLCKVFTQSLNTRFFLVFYLQILRSFLKGFVFVTQVPRSLPSSKMIWVS